MISPVALSSIGWKYYLLFVSICACVPAVVLPFYPETMGHNLEAIDQVFPEAPSIWEIVPMASKVPQGDVVEVGPISEKRNTDEIVEHKEHV
jgi:hypothetical protein